VQGRLLTEILYIDITLALVDKSLNNLAMVIQASQMQGTKSILLLLIDQPRLILLLQLVNDQPDGTGVATQSRVMNRTETIVVTHGQISISVQ